MGIMKSMAYPERGGAALRYLAAALAFVSEFIHLWVLPGQLVAAILPGFFFLLVAACQRLLGVSLLFGSGRWAVRFGILLNLFVVFVWAFTRVVSIPELFAPLRLPVSGLDLAATAQRGCRAAYVGDPLVGATKHQDLHELLKDLPIRYTGPVTAEWMVRLTTLGQQGPELLPDGLDEVWLKCGPGVMLLLVLGNLQTTRGYHSSPSYSDQFSGCTIAL